MSSIVRTKHRAAAAVAAPEIQQDYQPILDVARGIAAGFQAHVQWIDGFDASGPSLLGVDLDGSLTASALGAALTAFPSLPPNTFLSVPIGAPVAGSWPVRAALGRHRSLAGLVLDVVGAAELASRDLEPALAVYRAAGAIIAVGGYGAPQPELTSIVRLKPSIIRLGRDWVREVDASAAKRSAISVLGKLAGQLDAWILAEGVGTAAELRTLAGLGVPLAQGEFIGAAGPGWPEIGASVLAVLPDPTATATAGALRDLVQPAYTTTDASAAAAVLPETTGFDVVVVLDSHHRPVSVLERRGELWDECDALAVNVATPVADALSRAMVRPRRTRFAPLTCTDDTGRFLGILPIDQLTEHLTRG